MNMKLYWLKIAASALLIFAIGYGGMSVFRSTKREVVRAVDSNDDLTIPLPFLPFNLDGTKVGTFRKLVIHRNNPNHVSGVDVSVRLADASALDRFSSCHLTVDDPTKVNEHTSFRCVTMDSTMEAFGSVVVQTRDSSGDWNETATIPLALPISVARSIRGEDVQANVSQLEADRFKEIGDSLGALGRELGRASTDSAREAIEERMQDLRDEMEELQDNIAEAARSRAEEAVERANARIERRVKERIEAHSRAPKPPTPPEKPQ